MTFRIKRGDTRPSLTVQLTGGNNVGVDLSSVNDIEFRMRSQEGVLVIDENLSGPVNIEDAATGDVEYVWQTGDTSDVGLYEAEFEVEYSDGGKESFPSDDYLIVEIEEGTS